AKSANPYQGINKTGSIGLPFPDTIMKIVDAEDGQKELPPGETGEIILKSPDIMLGYYKNPEDTNLTIRDGWLFTGDLGWMDEEGYFYIVERKKDLIITSGFNVYPNEVEDVLYSHPAVNEACVVGIPDSYRGEAVKAFIVLRPGQEVGPEELKAFCAEQLTPYKVPRTIEIRNELPKSAIGKILRKELRGVG
ncbi:MAG: AMP-binding protein, partial [Bacillota bacterium]